MKHPLVGVYKIYRDTSRCHFHCRVLYRIVAMWLRVVAMSLRVVVCRPCKCDGDIIKRHATMRSDIFLMSYVVCRMSRFCLRVDAGQFQTTCDNLKGHSTMRSDILDNIVSHVARLPVKGKKLASSPWYRVIFVISICHFVLSCVDHANATATLWMGPTGFHKIQLYLC
jgi:hypothetical protein